ncbi:hypothetical protein HF086_018100 [Spodoptera exigua]|uniref:Uncharacterized protein n=1 Tax=Spodoptera exigua TaxID=7107 RepID=A0A922MQ06_SPOEX|nr:hypothetical protein HF086_018100 [Spodoptera exigua]
MSLQGSGGYQSPWSSQGGHSELDSAIDLEPLGELTEVGFEPQTRARSNTWPLPRPDNYVEAADDTGSKKNSNQNLSGKYYLSNQAIVVRSQSRYALLFRSTTDYVGSPNTLLE